MKLNFGPTVVTPIFLKNSSLNGKGGGEITPLKINIGESNKKMKVQ